MLMLTLYHTTQQRATTISVHQNMDHVDAEPENRDMIGSVNASSSKNIYNAESSRQSKKVCKPYVGQEFDDYTDAYSFCNVYDIY